MTTPSAQTNPAPTPAGRRRRWAIPTVAALVVAGGVGYGAVQAGASSGLEPKTAEQILTGMQSATVQPLSGTVVATADLGLPDIPGAADSPELTSLISGSHTVRVWYGGPEQVRIAKLGGAAETNVIRNGTDAWIWSSAEKKAVHHTVPQHAADGTTGTHDDDAPTGMPTTPQEASQAILGHLSEDSTVSTTTNSTVAGRDAYELVITPKQKNTLVRDVRLAVDGETMMPLRVQVFSTKLQGPAYEVGFTSLDLGAVEDRMFTFTPPAGTTVEEAVAPAGAAAHHDAATNEARTEAAKAAKADKAGAGTNVVGQGWERVYVASMPAGALEGAMAGDGESDEGGRGPHGRSDVDPAAVLGALPERSGSWGSGRVLDGTLFSVILADDGRVAMGAVGADQLAGALETGR